MNEYNLVTQKMSYSIKEINDMIENHDFQSTLLCNMEGDHWFDARKKEYIDSISIGFPLTPIYIGHTGGKHDEILDGYKRLMTINDCINRKGFKKLSEKEQRKFLNKSMELVRVTFIEEDKHDIQEAMKLIRRRLNPYVKFEEVDEDKNTNRTFKSVIKEIVNVAKNTEQCIIIEDLKNILEEYKNNNSVDSFIFDIKNFKFRIERSETFSNDFIKVFLTKKSENNISETFCLFEKIDIESFLKIANVFYLNT
jgi:hypothetical protein